MVQPYLNRLARRPQVRMFALVPLGLGLAACALVGRGWSTESTVEQAVALGTRLLPTVYPRPLADLSLGDAHPRRDGEYSLVARWRDDAGAARRASLTVDMRREEIRTYVGPLLTDLPDRSPEGRLRTAEGFARAHLGPFTEATRLVSQEQSMDVFFLYTWANVLPSGAWTGDWWSVEVDASPGEGGVHAFIVQRAPRDVAEDEVRIPQNVALETAERALDRHAGRTEQIRAREARLVLSSPNSPSLGPVWHVTFRAGESTRLDLQIDGITGKVLRQ